MSDERNYSPAVGEALAFAAEVHAGQRRKGKEEPYLSHILRVAGLVAHYGGSETQIIAAALHDAAEDQGGAEMLDEIRARFGDSAAEIVREGSDSLVAKGTAKAPWKERKLEYLARVESRGVSPASLVEAADKLSNLEDIVEDLGIHDESFLDRFSGGADGVRWYYSELGRVLIPQVPALSTRYQELLESLVTRP